jgi:hypothetical protein
MIASHASEHSNFSRFASWLTPLHRSDKPRKEARIGLNQYAHPDAPKPIHPDKEHFCSSTIKLGTNIQPPTPQTFSGIAAMTIETRSSL